MTADLEKSSAADLRLSVIVTSIENHGSLKSCLDSILPQKTDEVEIVVMVSGSPTADVAMTNDYSEVNFIENPDGTTLARLLSEGIERAKGEIVAITDSTCIVADDWISSILRAHETDFPVIGGSVEIADGDNSLTVWAAYFCDYGQFMRPAFSGVVNVIPGNNFSIKRPILEKGREFIENEFWKTLWCVELQSEGIELFFEPKISVTRSRKYTLVSFLSGRFHKGRCFAGMRAKDFSAIKSLVYALGSPLLPILAFIRIAAPVFHKQRHIGKLFLSIPLIILSMVFWTAGEMTAYFAGTGKRCEYGD